MMRREQTFPWLNFSGERRVACIARRCFNRQPGIARNRNGDDAQRNAELLAQCCASCSEIGGGGLQTMIDVHRAQRQRAEILAEGGGCTKQSGGIRASAQSHHQAADPGRHGSLERRVQGRG